MVKVVVAVAAVVTVVKEGLRCQHYKSVSLCALPALVRSAGNRCMDGGGAFPRLAAAFAPAASTKGLRVGDSSFTLGRLPTAMLSRGPSDGSKYLVRIDGSVCASESVSVRFWCAWMSSVGVSVRCGRRCYGRVGANRGSRGAQLTWLFALTVLPTAWPARQCHS